MPPSDETTEHLSPVERRRRERSAAILRETRRIFDEKGIRGAQIEELAQAVGINRAIIYRHFSSKEEIFAFTLVDYLADLRQRFEDADASAVERGCTPYERLIALSDAYFDFGMQYPAFIDSAQTLMMQTAAELLELVDSQAMLALGIAMAEAFGPLVTVLQAGCHDGVFHVDDPAATANVMYAQGLGCLALARLGAKVSTGTDGLVKLDELAPAAVRDQMRTAALALAQRS